MGQQPTLPHASIPDRDGGATPFAAPEAQHGRLPNPALAASTRRALGVELVPHEGDRRRFDAAVREFLHPPALRVTWLDQPLARTRGAP